MSRWVDLDLLRRSIAASARSEAEAAGLEGARVSVYVRIADPDGRGARAIEVEVIEEVGDRDETDEAATPSPTSN